MRFFTLVPVLGVLAVTVAAAIEPAADVMAKNLWAKHFLGLEVTPKQVTLDGRDEFLGKSEKDILEGVKRANAKADDAARGLCARADIVCVETAIVAAPANGVVKPALGAAYPFAQRVVYYQELKNPKPNPHVCNLLRDFEAQNTKNLKNKTELAVPLEQVNKVRAFVKCDKEAKPEQPEEKTGDAADAS